MAIRSGDKRDGSGRSIKSSTPKSNPEPTAEVKPKYSDGKIVRDDDDDDGPTVRDHRVKHRKDFTDSIQAKGGEGRTYPQATNKLYGKIFRSGTPMGKPDDWDEEDQKRVTVGSRFARDYVDNGDDGHYNILNSTERGGADANGKMNEDGVEPWWRKIVGYDNHEQAKMAEEKESRKVTERPQTDADQEDDSHLTPGQKLMKQHRAKQQAEESGGGFLRACFGKDMWEERAEREAAEQRADSSSSSDDDDDEPKSGGGFLRWLINP